MEDRLDKLIEKTSYIYDLEDTAEWIMENKEELLQILNDITENNKHPEQFSDIQGKELL